MADIPAFCDNCGHIFTVASFEGRNITLTGNVATCPVCRSKASIPDGVYNFIGDTIELIKGPEITVKRLKELQKIINEIIHQKPSYEEVKSKLDKETPELKKITDILPNTRKELYLSLSFLLTLIIFVFKQCEGEEVSITHENIFNYYNIHYAPQINIEKSTDGDSTQIHVKPGRNDPCPCGSNKKYKHCHGKNK